MQRFRRIILSCLIAGGGIITAIRWNAWFGMPDEPIWTRDTIPCHFTILTDSVASQIHSDTIRFIVLGDIHSSADSTVYRRLSDRHPQVTCFLQTGDWIERPYLYYIQGLTHALSGSRFDSIPVLFVPGNHEYTKGFHRQLPSPWDPTNRVVDFPNMRLVAINTMGLHTLTDYTRTNVWAKRVIQHDSIPRMHIVVMHHPVYSTARGRFNPLIWLTFVRSLNRADVVINGHDHHYVRQSIWHLAPIWKDIHPTMHITLNSSHKRYPTKNLSRYLSVVTDQAVYLYGTAYNDSIKLQTLCLTDGVCADSCVITQKTY